MNMVRSDPMSDIIKPAIDNKQFLIVIGKKLILFIEMNFLDVSQNLFSVSTYQRKECQDPQAR